MIRGLLLVPVFAAVFSAAISQSQPVEKKKGKESPNSLSPTNPAKVYAAPKKKNKTNERTYDAVDDYYDRTEGILKDRARKENSKRKLREDERMKPPYFGHKRPPKIRPIEKRKYCKVCGIRH
jgi:hypothetical protein